MGIEPLDAGGASYAYGISADGTTVVGAVRSVAGDTQAFRWTDGSGIVPLGTLGGVQSTAHDVSANGRVVAGWSVNGGGFTEAFRWEQGDSPEMQGLGFLAPAFSGRGSTAKALSDSGREVVGASSTDVLYQREAFLWSMPGETMEGLGSLWGGLSLLAYSEGEGISGDGRVVVGSSKVGNTADVRHAFVQTDSGGMVALGTLLGTGIATGVNSFAIDASYDGSVVVGHSVNNSGKVEAFRWQQGQTPEMAGLGMVHPSDLSSQALAVSADGSTVVGAYVQDNGENRAFVWNAQSGIVDLQELLATQGGLSGGLADWSLSQATAVSADGRRIAGWGYFDDGNQPRARAFVAVVPEPGGPLLLLAIALLGVVLATANRLRGDYVPPGADDVEIHFHDHEDALRL